MREFSREEIYGCDLREFCRRTYISPDLLIMSEKAKIDMLKRSYEKNRQKLMEAEYGEDEWDYLVDLSVTIKLKLDKAKRNLERYEQERRELERMGTGNKAGNFGTGTD